MPAQIAQPKIEALAAFIASHDMPMVRVFTTSCPEVSHQKHSGQVVEAFADPIYEPGVFRVVAKDGWQGLAFADELSDAKGAQ